MIEYHLTWMKRTKKSLLLSPMVKTIRGQILLQGTVFGYSVDFHYLYIHTFQCNNNISTLPFIHLSSLSSVRPGLQICVLLFAECSCMDLSAGSFSLKWPKACTLEPSILKSTSTGSIQGEYHIIKHEKYHLEALVSLFV